MSKADDYKYFTKEEILCPCGQCKEEDVPDSVWYFFYSLDSLRDYLEIPLPVNSGYRCPDYNAEISATGSRTGSHTTGAADIRVSGKEAYQLLSAVLSDTDPMFFTGVGIKQKGDINGRFIHLDSSLGTDAQPRPWVWTY